MGQRISGGIRQDSIVAVRESWPTPLSQIKYNSPIGPENVSADRVTFAILGHHLPVNRLAVVMRGALKATVGQFTYLHIIVCVEHVLPLRLGIVGLDELHNGRLRYRPDTHLADALFTVRTSGHGWIGRTALSWP